MISPSERPYRVLVVTGVYPTREVPHLGTFIKTQVESLREAGVEVEVIHPGPGRPMPLRYASAAVQVFVKTLTGRFDIVHGHYGLWCLAARLQWTTPVVASFLGTDLLGGVASSGQENKKDALVASISRWLARRVDAVNVKSEQMKKALRGGCTVVYPDGVDFDLFHPIPRAEARAKLGWPQEGYFVLFGNDPGRSEKNFPLARAAIERLHARGVAAQLVVAHGLPQRQVVQYINASNAVILPSVYEGSPNIVKEAMACNIAVVATNVGDVSQVIGRTLGCKVCSSNPDDLAAGLEEAFLHAGSTTGRADIPHLERSAITRQIIAVYDQVARRRKRLSPSRRSRRESGIRGAAKVPGPNGEGV